MTEYLITRLGHTGDGIADGPVYAPRTLPGEIVSGDLDGTRLTNVKILKPTAERVAPPCKHFKNCGACSLQHARDDFVSKWKAQVVAQALKARELSAPIRAVYTSPPQSRRRVGLAGKRSKSGAIVGFHARASDVVVDVPQCQLMLPEIMKLLPALAQLTELGASRKSTIELMVTWSDSGADVSVSGALEISQGDRRAAIEIARQGDFARLSWNEELFAEFRRPELSFGDITVCPPPNAFLQATKQGEDRLRMSVGEAVGEAGHVVDLFSGCGTFALPLSRQMAVHAVEADADLLDALDQAWRTAKGLREVTTEPRDLFRRPLLPIELKRFDAAVIDPPRAGAEAQTFEIANSALSRLAMVSCNPVTFARDARILSDHGFQFDWIDVVDQFRWSPHIELVACLTR